MNSRFRHKRPWMDGMRNAITVRFCLSLLSAYPAGHSAASSDRVPQHVTERFAISLSAVDALEALTSGRMTSVQYVDVLLQRIVNHPEINALFISIRTRLGRRLVWPGAPFSLSVSYLHTALRLQVAAFSALLPE